MKAPELPPDESQRIATLRSLNVLDTSPEERFDRLTRLAKRLFGVPIALVSLVDSDRQWFKSCVGLDATETPRNISFCGHAILHDDILTVPDTLSDPRFCDNPLVTGDPGIRFYAGCPLQVANGSRLGTLCLIDREPRSFDEDDRRVLRDLAQMAEQELAAVQLATMDELTLLSNRRGFETLGEHAFSLCRRRKEALSVLFIDLDDFKQVNDRFGHAEGDRALQNFSEILRRTFRDSDVIGRLGGDEFAVVMSGAGIDEARPSLDRLDEEVDRLELRERRGYRISFSAGVVSADFIRHSDLAGILDSADRLMYQVKRDRKALRTA